MPDSELNVKVREVFLLPGIGVVIDAMIIEGTLRRGTRVRVQSSGEVAVVMGLEKNLRPVMKATIGDSVGVRLDFPYRVCNEAYLPTERNFRDLICAQDQLGSCEEIAAVEVVLPL